MEILLAVGLVAVTVAGWITTNRLRHDIHDNSKRLRDAHEAMSTNRDRIQSSEKEASGRLSKEHRDWSTAIDRLGGQVRKSITTVREDVQKALVLYEERQGEAVSRLRAELEQERRQRADAIQKLNDKLRRDADARHELDAQIRDVERQLAMERERTDHGLAEYARRFHSLDQRLSSIRDHILQSLDREVAAPRDPTRRVLIGVISADQRAAAEMLPFFYEDLCQTLSLEILFHQQLSRRASRYYLGRETWTGAPVDLLLDQLLKACPDGTAEEDLGGLHEMRNLFIATDHAESAAIQLGPLIVARVRGRFLGGVLAQAEPIFIGQPAPPSPDDFEEHLRTAESRGVIDLEPWATRYRAG